MQIQLKQADIEQAIRSHIAAIGITREVSDISFTMGRNGAGLSAGVEVSDTDNRIHPGGGLCHEGKVPVSQSTALDSATPEESEKADQELAQELAGEEPANEDEEEAPATKASLFGSAS